MDRHSHRGQILIETLMTTILLVSLSGYIWNHLNQHQNRLRRRYPNHEVSYENKSTKPKAQRKSSRSTKTDLDIGDTRSDRIRLNDRAK